MITKSPWITQRLAAVARDPRKIRRLATHFGPLLRTSVYNLGYRLAGAFDGYPFPPARLIDLVIGNRQISWYQLGGMFNHQVIVAMLRRNGVDVDAMCSLLDFGCGCGRVTRYWASLRNTCEIWGCDYNPALVKWCQRKLSDIGRFVTNGADPPLPFDSDKFDLVYSYSVFTHLSADRQRPWMKELVRILRPGGSLLVTLHGMSCAMRNGLSADEFRQLAQGELVVIGAGASGTNRCAAYHSEGYVRREFSPGLDLLEFLPRGTADASQQDIYLFRKRPVADPRPDSPGDAGKKN